MDHLAKIRKFGYEENSLKADFDSKLFLSLHVFCTRDRKKSFFQGVASVQELTERKIQKEIEFKNKQVKIENKKNVSINNTFDF